MSERTPAPCRNRKNHQARRAEGVRRKDEGRSEPRPFLLRKAGNIGFYNTSDLDLVRLLGDQDRIRQNLYAYVQAFSPAARDIFERFDFHAQVERLAKANLLYLVTEKFANVDLHPEGVNNTRVGLVFEELIRKFAGISNETAGEHFTPRAVIRLMVNLLRIEDGDVLTAGTAVVRTGQTRLLRGRRCCSLVLSPTAATRCGATFWKGTSASGGPVICG